MKTRKTVLRLVPFLVFAAGPLLAGAAFDPSIIRYGGNVRDFGAVGDGVTDDTAAVQKAIDAGGVVRFPEGVYLISPIYLKSNGGLDLDTRAVIRFQPDRSKWKIRAGSDKPNGFANVHLVNVIGQTNVFIRGGAIDGNFRRFYKRVYLYACSGRRFMTPAKKKGDPAQLVWFHETSDIHLQDVRIFDAPFWALWLHGCENVVLRDLVVEGSDEICNTDGIDIDCCCHVRMTRCKVRAGDDALAVRGAIGGLSRPMPCEDIVVEDCDLASHYAHALRVGVGSGEIRNCRFSKIRMEDTRGGIWVCSKFKGGSGAAIYDIVFDDILMDAVCGIYVRHDYYLVKKTEPFRGVLRDIRFSNVRGTSMLQNSVVGNGVAEMRNIAFTNCNVKVATPRGLPPGDREFFSLGPEIKGQWYVRNADVIGLSPRAD